MIHFTNEVPGANPTGREWHADFPDLATLLEDPRIRAYEDMGDPRVMFYRWSRTKAELACDTCSVRDVPKGDGRFCCFDVATPAERPVLCLLFAEYGNGKAKLTIGYLSGDREAIEKLSVWTPPAVDPGLLAKVKKTEHAKHRTLRIPKGMIVKSTGNPIGVDPHLEDTLKELAKRGEKVLGWTIDENRDEYKIKVMSKRPDAEKVDERPRIYVP